MFLEHKCPCSKFSSGQCVICDRTLDFCQMECESHNNGECKKCNQVRADAAIKNGVLCEHSIYELELLGVNLRFLRAIEKFLGFFSLGQLIEVPMADLKAIPNTGPKFRDQLSESLSRYYELGKKQKEQSASLAKVKDDYDDRHRWRGDTLPQ